MELVAAVSAAAGATLAALALVEAAALAQSFAMWPVAPQNMQSELSIRHLRSCGVSLPSLPSLLEMSFFLGAEVVAEVEAVDFD